MSRAKKPISFKPRKVSDIPDGMPWVPMTDEVIEALLARRPSYRAIRILFCLMLEHLAHAGKENGYLIKTHRQLCKDAHLSPVHVKPALDELVDGGWLAIEHKGSCALGAKPQPVALPDHLPQIQARQARLAAGIFGTDLRLPPRCERRVAARANLARGGRADSDHGTGQAAMGQV
jgi:hypothetical protein